MLRVKRLKRDFPLPQVNVAILQTVRKLGYDRHTKDQRDAIRSFVGADVFVFLLGVGNRYAMHASQFYLIFFGVMQVSKHL